MKNDIKINILNHGKVEIIDDEEFIQKLRNSKKLEEYVTLELMRADELQEIIQNEKIYKYNENKFDYLKLVIDDLRARGYADFLPAYNLDGLRHFAVKDERPSLVSYIDNVMALCA